MDYIALLRQHEAGMKARFGITRIGIFGSCIRDEERPDSDIDILVEFAEGEETYDHYYDLRYYLEDLFGRRVDLVLINGIKRRLRESILHEVVYASIPPAVS